MNKKGDQNTKQMKDFSFENRAEKYDKGFEGSLSARFYNLIINNIELEDNYKILDCGCGTGTILEKLSKKKKVHCYGIDVEDKMLKIATAKNPDIDIWKCPCDATSFDDCNFDILIACMAYHHFSDRNGFAKEAARLLKHNGKLYISDPNLPFPIRIAVNTAMKIHRINGKLFKSEEIISNFEPYGFKHINTYKDKYAQLVVLERN